MARAGAYLRNISKLNLLFGVGSLLLLLGILGMLADDYIREWKHYQREFNRLEVQKTKDSINEEEAKIDKEKLKTLIKQIDAGKKEIKGREKEMAVLKKEIKGLEAKIYKSNQEFQFAKSRFAAVKYQFEEAEKKGKTKEAKAYEEELHQETKSIDKWKKEMDVLTQEKENKEEVLGGYLTKNEELEKKVGALLKGKRRFEKKLAKIKPGFRTWLLNLPMLDFIAPTRKIEQVVLEDLKEDYHFATVPRIDRCMTCHLGIDEKGWEEDIQPFKTHPRLDLFVSSNSPHPVEKFGCTVCHGGSGQAVTFFDSAHTPQSEEQEKGWVKNYHWKPQKYVEDKMVPMNLIESSCLQCHSQGGVVDIPEAPKLSFGKELFEDRGCYACHTVKGFEDFQNPGPDLTHLASKTDKEWTSKWLKSPLTFRPDTKMPQFFDLSNSSLPEDLNKSKAEIEGIVAYLFDKSKPIEMPQPLEGGDVEKGKELVANLGCMGCHAVEDWEGTNFGPDLKPIGSKVNAAWLQDWLKNPKHYWKETRMPQMRINDEEARDISAYLLTLKNEPFDKMEVPVASKSALDEMAMEYLLASHGTLIGKQKFDAMSLDEKKVYVGERAITHYGCAGCHTIPGFEGAVKIGTELTEEGSKDPHTLEFGNVHIDHTRQAWFFAKMKDPRVFDEGKVKTRLEKLKMPNFNFSDEEAEALTLFLLSLKKSEISPNMKKQLTEKEKSIEQGRRLVREFNCQACHSIENKGGEIALTLGEGLAPPPLNGEGEKVWGDWLHSFLKEPSTIRPWLQVRMPTFGFSDKEATALVRYFEDLDNQKLTYKSKEDQIPKPTREQWEAGKQIVESFRCMQCHEAEPSPGKSAADLAPDLALSRDRLKPRWIVKWMVDPQKLYPGTRMPGYFPDLQSPLPDVLGGSAKKQIIAIRNYILNLDLYEEAKAPKKSNNKKSRQK